MGYSFASMEATNAVPLGMNDKDVTSQNSLRLWSDSKYSGEMAKEWALNVMFFVSKDYRSSVDKSEKAKVYDGSPTN
jgi:hypothetical protein